MPQLEFAKKNLLMSLKALLVAAAVFIMWRASRGGQKKIRDHLSKYSLPTKNIEKKFRTPMKSRKMWITSRFRSQGWLI